MLWESDYRWLFLVYLTPTDKQQGHRLHREAPCSTMRNGILDIFNNNNGIKL